MRMITRLALALVAGTAALAASASVGPDTGRVTGAEGVVAVLDRASEAPPGTAHADSRLLIATGFFDDDFAEFDDADFFFGKPRFIDPCFGARFFDPCFKRPRFFDPKPRFFDPFDKPRFFDRDFTPKRDD